MHASPSTEQASKHAQLVTHARGAGTCSRQECLALIIWTEQESNCAHAGAPHLSGAHATREHYCADSNSHRPSKQRPRTQQMAAAVTATCCLLRARSNNVTGSPGPWFAARMARVVVRECRMRHICNPLQRRKLPSPSSRALTRQARLRAQREARVLPCCHVTKRHDACILTQPPGVGGITLSSAWLTQGSIDSTVPSRSVKPRLSTGSLQRIGPGRRRLCHRI